jgi:hypothetical protein
MVNGEKSRTLEAQGDTPNKLTVFNCGVRIETVFKMPLYIITTDSIYFQHPQSSSKSDPTNHARTPTPHQLPHPPPLRAPKAQSKSPLTARLEPNQMTRLIKQHLIRSPNFTSYNHFNTPPNQFRHPAWESQDPTPIQKTGHSRSM